MDTSNELQNWYTRRSRSAQALLIGVSIGLTGGLTGLMLALAGPIITIGAVLGLLAALYVLTDISAALYGVIAVNALLPFGAMPFKIGLTPTLLDAALGAFVIVYLFQWMTGRRIRLQITPVHALVIIYGLWLILAFALGLRYAPPTPAKQRQFAETLLSISMVFILVDLLRDPASLRRLLLVFMGAMGVQAIVTIGLYVLPDDFTERLLVRLARIGYPDGGVIRYIEDNPALAERAIGTWVDPNALGGVLAISASLIAPQLFAQKPVLRWRWPSLLLLGAVCAALFLTFSRASILGFACAVLFVGVMRYRRYIPVLIAGGLLLLLLPQTQIFIERFTEAFTGADLATQMRLGEYSDSLRLISQYPIFGVGFTGTPGINLYTDVASMYLIMGNQIGLVGVGIFGLTMLVLFIYGLGAWRTARQNVDLDSIHLGLHAALLAALVDAVADHFFFRLDFQASVTLFWLVVALALATSRLARESTVVKYQPLR
jgi:hypothetical protein